MKIVERIRIGQNTVFKALDTDRAEKEWSFNLLRTNASKNKGRGDANEQDRARESNGA